MRCLDFSENGVESKNIRDSIWGVVLFCKPLTAYYCASSLCYSLYGRKTWLAKMTTVLKRSKYCLIWICTVLAWIWYSGYYTWLLVQKSTNNCQTLHVKQRIHVEASTYLALQTSIIIFSLVQSLMPSFWLKTRLLFRLLKKDNTINEVWESRF